VASLAEPSIAPPQNLEQRERRFFLGMAIAIAGAVLLGFGGYMVLGISSFGAPWWVHIHAVTFMGWVALYLNQNLLVVRGNIARHRQMGRITAGWAAWMLLVGTVVLFANTATHRTPPIFTPPLLVAMDGINLLLFLALVVAGLMLRHRTDWHRRLMLSATVCIIAPALGRITVMSGGFSLRNEILIMLGFIAVAMLADLRLRGRIHPAYYWGAATMIVMGLATKPVSELAPIIALANAVAGG
jgi:hypothetical protein